MDNLELNTVKDRLRLEEKIVGYRRVDFGDRAFYSKDGMWWSGDPILFDTIDKTTSLLDKNQRTIYEKDNILIIDKKNDVYFYAQVFFDSEKLLLRDLESGLIYDLVVDYETRYSSKMMEIVNYRFEDLDFSSQFPYLSSGDGLRCD
tara:strand:- start:655 stop:1095 length:441 start_codon:yes stop_codon:yes gene_type:complete